MGFLKRIYKENVKMSENVMIVNCAHGKGIRFIRDEIKFFAKTNLQPGISFKCVVLLNADHLTIDAQSALRRCIEQYSHHTRFFIVVEHKHRLLPPIISRFCELYIPDIVNSYVDQSRVSIISPFLEVYTKRNSELTHIEMVNTSSTLYENAFSAQDIMEWLWTRSEWTHFEKANVGMYFSKISSEFRSEKLLMLVLLSFITGNSGENLQRLSFM